MDYHGTQDYGHTTYSIRYAYFHVLYNCDKPATSVSYCNLPCIVRQSTDLACLLTNFMIAGLIKSGASSIGQ